MGKDVLLDADVLLPQIESVDIVDLDPEMVEPDQKSGRAATGRPPHSPL